MSESRQELVAWVNELLDLNYTKIEQMGTGNGLMTDSFDSSKRGLPSRAREYTRLLHYKNLSVVGWQTSLQRDKTRAQLDNALPIGPVTRYFHHTTSQVVRKQEVC